MKKDKRKSNKNKISNEKNNIINVETTPEESDTTNIISGEIGLESLSEEKESNLFDILKERGEVENNMIDNIEVQSDDCGVINIIGNLFKVKSFNDLYLMISEKIDNNLLAISQSVKSADPSKYSLFISGDIEQKRPNLVLVPLENNTVKVQVFNDPIYIYDEEYPSKDIPLEIGLASMVQSFIENGNGYGISFEDEKVFL